MAVLRKLMGWCKPRGNPGQPRTAAPDLDRPSGVSGSAKPPLRKAEWRRAAYLWGRVAEMVVALRYRLRGYRILAQRFRSRSGEVDLIARRGRRVVFIEVKARRGDASPQSVLSEMAIRRIRAAADDFLARHPRLSQTEARFDLAMVGTRGVTIHADAF